MKATAGENAQGQAAIGSIRKRIRASSAGRQQEVGQDHRHGAAARQDRGSKATSMAAAPRLKHDDAARIVAQGGSRCVSPGGKQPQSTGRFGGSSAH